MSEKVPLTGAQTFRFYLFFWGGIHAYIPIKLIPETKTQNGNGKRKNSSKLLGVSHLEKLRVGSINGLSAHWEADSSLIPLPAVLWGTSDLFKIRLSW